MQTNNLIRKYKHKKTTKIWPYNPWNQTAEPGDLMITHNGTLYRLTQSTGRNKRATGELTPKKIKPPQPGLTATIHNNEIWWKREIQVKMLSNR